MVVVCRKKRCFKVVLFLKNLWGLLILVCILGKVYFLEDYLILFVRLGNGEVIYELLILWGSKGNFFDKMLMMFVVFFRGVNYRFWFFLGCLGWNINIFLVNKVFFRVYCEEIIKNIVMFILK